MRDLSGVGFASDMKNRLIQTASTLSSDQFFTREKAVEEIMEVVEMLCELEEAELRKYKKGGEL
ncbi:hypothetical protein [Cohnella silvisoli]|uniref:Uncharacterized protein n=1 Tax=Cohnella silvisoli TaxID=2873699 RepID=A0ABV1L4I1_9BACL|nr:hypothetical protein [Cohnella silvisoli]MCD9026020.1 hypothetical protein [Cohnella silvisoli]